MIERGGKSTTFLVTGNTLIVFFDEGLGAAGLETHIKNGILPRRALPLGEGYRQFLELKRALNNRIHISYY